MKKITALVLALTMVCSLFAMAGYAEEKKEIETVTPGVLTVATSPDFAPYEFYALDEEGNPTLAGFDMALAQYIADYLGLELEVIPMDFDGTLMELASKNVDLAMAGYSPDPARMDKMDFSDLPALLGAFALGPVYGVVISFMKNLLHIVIKGTSTACVGELCNFMLGAVFSAVAGVIYKHHKSRKTAIIGAIAGAAAMAVFSVPSNYFITYPAYVQFYHMPLEAILGMYQAILPSADSLIKCLVIFNMPFTLVKGLLDAVLCMLIYKPLSPILHGRK